LLKYTNIIAVPLGRSEHPVNLNRKDYVPEILFMFQTKMQLLLKNKKYTRREATLHGKTAWFLTAYQIRLASLKEKG